MMVAALHWWRASVPNSSFATGTVPAAPRQVGTRVRAEPRDAAWAGVEPAETMYSRRAFAARTNRETKPVPLIPHARAHTWGFESNRPTRCSSRHLFA